MSNALSGVRAELADTLNSSGALSTKCYVTVPEEASAPLVVTAAGRPYLDWTTEGTAYGCVIVRLQVLVVAEQAENDAEDEQLDGLVLDVLTGLRGSRFTVTDVEQPTPVGVNGQEHLGVFVNVWTEAELGV